MYGSDMAALRSSLSCIYIIVALAYGGVGAVRIPDVQESFRDVQKTLATKFPTKGTPFPTIPGPKSKHDRIAIIGAGPGGVHMAYLLKKAGFTDVCILERSNRIGGKSYTIHHRGIPVDMGTLQATIDFKILFDLLKEFKAAGNTIPHVGSAVFDDGNTCSNGTSNINWFIKLIGQTGIAANQTQAHFADGINRYITLHKKMFGDYDTDIFPRPDQSVLHEIRGTTQEFLIRNDLIALRGLFEFLMTFLGYGYLDEVPAVYALQWVTPNLVGNTLLSGLTKKAVSFNLVKGWQVIWETIVKEMKIPVHLHHNVIHIDRQSSRTRYMYHSRRRFHWFLPHRAPDRTAPVRLFFSSSKMPRDYDFVIITASMRNMIWKMDASREERRIFSRYLSPAYFTLTLFDTTRTPTSFLPGLYNADKILDEHSVYGIADSFALHHGLAGPDYNAGKLPSSPPGYNADVYTLTSYQYSTHRPTLSTIRRKFRNYIRECQYPDVRVFARAFWSYFHHFSTKDLRHGILWDIFDMQGQRNTWYAGSSVTFESVRSVTEYNALLMRQYTP